MSRPVNLHWLGGAHWAGDDETGRPATVAEAAALYAAHRWRLFPCGGIDGKKPLTPHGLHDASADPRQIEEWWSRWPTANLGWALPVGVWLLDVDPRHGGDVTLRDLERRHAPLPTLTLRGQTGGSGEHWTFRKPAGLSVRQCTGFAPGLDTRVGGKGYVLVPPSRTVRPYRWIASVAPVEAPAWLVELVRERAHLPSRQYIAPATPDPASHTCRRGYARAALDGEAREVAAAPVGTRNDRLFRAWARCNGFRDVLSEAEARSVLLAAALAAGLDEREAAGVLR